MKEQIAQREREKQEALELHMEIQHDRLDNETTYHPKIGESFFTPYIYAGNGEPPNLNLQISYYGSEILSVEKCYIFIDGKKHLGCSSFKRERYDSNEQRSIMSIYDSAMLEAIEKSDEAIIRFIGTSGFNSRKIQVDREIQYRNKKGIRHTLDAFDTLKSNFKK